MVHQDNDVFMGVMMIPHATFLHPWEPGRQLDCDYQKKLVWQFGISDVFTDCYLLRYAAGASLPIHKDPVETRRHFRLNIVFGAKGVFSCKRTIINILGRVILFRPDLYEHGMHSDGERFVISIGLRI